MTVNQYRESGKLSGESRGELQFNVTRLSPILIPIYDALLTRRCKTMDMSVQQIETTDGSFLIFNVRRESTVVMENDAQDFVREFTFDYEGRLVGAFVDGRNYRRSLDNQILEKQSGPRPGLAGRLRRFLTPDQVSAFETHAYDYVRALPARLRNPLNPDYRDAFTRIANFSSARLERERVRFHQLYHPVTIMPPDQYLALYLQATEGCSYNRCAFCGLYRDRRFHVKTPEEFRKHLLDVRDFFGGGLTMRRSIFLGDANALMIPQTELLAFLDVINTEFAILPADLENGARRAWEHDHPIHFQGIYSFIDAFTTRQKTSADFAEIGRRGVRRAYVGLESGDPELLHFLGKPNPPPDVFQLVERLKAGGIAVGIIVLVGAGGERYQTAHVHNTISLINSLPLDENDLIYLSQLVDYPGSTYSDRAAEAGIRALDQDELERQTMQFRMGLTARYHEHAPKISYYDIREFVY